MENRHSVNSGRWQRFLLIAGICLVAANLRTPFTGVPPLLGQIRETFGLGATAAGALTATPLLVFALVSPFVAGMARRWGLERTVWVGVLLIGGGVLARSSGQLAPLYLGTAVIGVGIAIGNVLLPSLLKRDFHAWIAPLTVLYSLVMGSVAALASTVVVPLTEASPAGWRFALAVLGVPAVLAALVWLPQLRRRSEPATAAASLTTKSQPLWRTALAWQVTLFIGINSLLYYVVIAWQPTILDEIGYAPSEAGALHGALQLSSALAGVLLMPFIRRGDDQRVLALVTSAFVLVGLLGLWLVPQWGLACSIVFGLGGGAVFVLALSFIGMRASTSGQAASLSGMAQSIGYLMAASAPAAVGSLREMSHSWSLPLVLCVGLSVVMASCGYYAGRPVRLPEP